MAEVTETIRMKCLAALLLLASVSNVVRGELLSSRQLLEEASEPAMVEWLQHVRRTLHEYPELKWEEERTSALIREELERIGVAYEYPVAKHGVVAIVGNAEAPVVALRADMDALPIPEAGSWAHKSKRPGKMHACGHDLHVTMLLGAAKLLHRHRHLLEGSVRLLFQPAEEGGAGAGVMIDEGALGDACAIFGFHVDPRFPVGMVESKPGPFLASSCVFEVEIRALGGHAAFPSRTADPILTAASLVLSLQQLVSRECDPLDTVVISVTAIDGGTALNVIPSLVTIKGTIRAFEHDTAARIERRMEEVHPTVAFLLGYETAHVYKGWTTKIVVQQAAALGCKAELFLGRARPRYPPLVCDEGAYRHMRRVAADMLGQHNVHLCSPKMVSEDFGMYLHRIPGAFLIVGVGAGAAAEDATPAADTPELHSSHFSANEDVLPMGAALHASLALSFLQERRADAGRPGSTGTSSSHSQ